MPLSKATSPEVLLAWAMNGEPLTAVHGAPVRVVVPGYIGARSVKWVTRVTVRAEPSDNFFQETAYRLLPVDGVQAPGAGLSLGPVALNSEILRPEHGDTVPAGTVRVSGYAYAGDDRSVCRVDVSVDGGATWRLATLGEASTWSLAAVARRRRPGGRAGRDRRTRLGQHGRDPARVGGPAVEPEGLRQQLVAAGHGDGGLTTGRLTACQPVRRSA